MIANYTAARASEAAANYNADMARIEGKSAVIAANQKAGQVSRQQRKILGQQSAVLGAAGIGQTGSPMETMVDTQAEYEKSLLDIGYGAHVALAEAEAHRHADADRLRDDVGPALHARADDHHVARREEPQRARVFVTDRA